MTPYEAGLARDYNGGEPYQNPQDAAEFNRGLADSMKAKPIAESAFKFVTIQHLTLGDVLAKQKADNRLDLIVCDECGAIADEADCEPTENPGERLCPICNITSMVKFGEDYLDNVSPYRVCEHCEHPFLWDDALGANEPGEYICPKCGEIT